MDNEIMYTSNVEEIFRLFLEKKIYISESSWMNTLSEVFDENFRIGSANITKDSIDMKTDDRACEISASYTYKDDISQERIARDIVVCYKENYYKAILLYGTAERSFLAFNMCSDNGLTKNMLLYFINTYGFVTDDIDIEEYEGRILRPTNVYSSPENDTLLVCGFPVEADPQEDEDGYEGKVYIYFDGDGKLISHSTDLSVEHGFLTIKLTKVNEREEDKNTEDLETVEEAFNDILTSIKALQTTITNLREEVYNKFEELNKLKRGSDD